MLYLLHGAVSTYRSWTESGDAERLTRRLPLIVVMPDSGTGGGYTDWYNGGRGGRPAWERYHIGQLLPFIDRRFRTVARRGGRAVAGLSMGGGGAMSYAARNPGLFGAAASFSGAVDLVNPAIVGVTGERPYGPFDREEVRWRARNPVDLAANLRGLRLTIRTGDGRPGGPLGGTSLDPVELVTHHASEALHRRLRSLRVAHTWEDYGPGNHTWPYWRRGLAQTLPGLMRTFAHPPAPPARVRFRAVEPRYRAYGWRVALRRPALEFSSLRDADPGGFRLTGSGQGTVTTPARYTPGARHRLLIADARGTRRVPARAGRRGRLRIAVSLGPAHRRQQYTPEARRAREPFRTATVRIGGPGG